MKKIASVMLLICLCLILAACGKSDAAQAAQETPAPVEETVAPTPEPTPEPTPVPVDLQPIVDQLNAVEMEQREKEYPFVGVYELTEDGQSINYKLALKDFGLVVLGADMGEAECIEAYNKTLDELPQMAIALENVMKEEAPGHTISLILMLEEHSDQVVAVVIGGQIVYDAINGVGVKPEGITPIIEPETTPAPAAEPAAEPAA